MRFDVVTIFPAMFGPVFQQGVIARGIERGVIGLAAHDLRQYTHDRHRQVDDTPRLEVHLEHGILRGRDQVLDGPFPTHPHVVGRPLEDLRDRAQRLPRAGLHRQPNHLVVVEASFRQRPPRVFRHLEIAAAEQVRDRAVVDALELDHQARHAGAAPLDRTLAPVQHQRGARAETIVEICQGYYLDSTVQSICTSHLAHADHECEPPTRGPRSRGGVCASDGLARSTNTRL